MGVTDANTAGNVHGGVILRLCDEAAGVYIGQLVTCRAMVNAAWRTSLEVGVRVEAEDVRTGDVRQACTAYLTMVALDRDGQPTAVPPLMPETPDEVRRQREAQVRRDNRLAEREAIRATRDEDD
jgi:acyl-CoA hydrolase